MYVGVVAGAAVWIWAVAVALDFACGLCWMLELMLVAFDLSIGIGTHGARVARRARRKALSPATTDLVRDAVDVARISHLNHSLDLIHCRCTESGRGLRVALVGVWTATEGIVGNLSALGVADDDQLRIWATRVEAVDGGSNCRDPSSNRGIVAGAAAGGLATTIGYQYLNQVFDHVVDLPCWVRDGFSSGTRIRIEH